MIDINHVIKNLAYLLQSKKWQLVTAESCTGGLISSYLTELPGSSNWFERGFELTVILQSKNYSE